jgi:hypothetical protein
MCTNGFIQLLSPNASYKVILGAFIKREGRRLRMLQGLPRIRHRVSSVSLYCLGDISTLGMHSNSILGIDPPNTIFGFGSKIMSFTWFI